MLRQLLASLPGFELKNKKGQLKSPPPLTRDDHGGFRHGNSETRCPVQESLWMRESTRTCVHTHEYAPAECPWRVLEGGATQIPAHGEHLLSGHTPACSGTGTYK